MTNVYYRRFWRQNMPRLKYWNPAIPMVVNRSDDQAGPARMTIYIRNSGQAQSANPLSRAIEAQEQGVRGNESAQRGDNPRGPPTAQEESTPFVVEADAVAQRATDAVAGEDTVAIGETDAGAFAKKVAVPMTDATADLREGLSSQAEAHTAHGNADTGLLSDTRSFEEGGSPTDLLTAKAAQTEADSATVLLRVVANADAMLKEPAPAAGANTSSKPSAQAKTATVSKPSSTQHQFTAPAPLPGERLVHIEMKHQTSDAILDALLKRTGAELVVPTTEEKAKMEEVQQRAMESDKMRKHVAGLVATQKRAQRTIAENLAKAAEIRAGN
jgi:hypothetical protein